MIRWWTILGALTLSACGSAPPPPLVRGPVPAALRAKMAADPHTFFRKTSDGFAAQSCATFAGAPATQLHGDLHLEQITANGQTAGLDDFDDAGRGPAGLDLVRFGVSLSLVCEARGLGPCPRFVDALAEGYAQGTASPAVLDALNAAAAARAPFTRPKLHPMQPEQAALFDRLWAAYGRSDLEILAKGLSKSGVGSVGALRFGVVVAPEPGARLVLEFKPVAARAVPCVVAPADPERVVAGMSALGHRAADPYRAVLAEHGYWVQAWSPRYAELDIEAIGAHELDGVARWVGARLARAHGPARVADWAPIRAEITRLRQLTVQAWQRFRASP